MKHDMEHGHAAQAPQDFLSNHPHQHAFMLVGDETVFAVHMTQYHTEEHKYQVILKVVLPQTVRSVLEKTKKKFPLDTFVLCNDDADLFIVPDLPSRRKKTFRANLFQGLPPFTEEDEKDPHFFPWDKARTKPLAADFEVEVERIVLFRPFAHHMKQPDHATYLLWGEGDEAHMTNLQTARLASGKFEVPGFGPDYDHIMSLARAPDWLDKPLLEAGIVVSVPSIRLNDKQTGKPTIPLGIPIKSGDEVAVLYRGVAPARTVTAATTVLAGTAVCNSPGLVDCPPDKALVMSQTPKGLMK